MKPIFYTSGGAITSEGLRAVEKWLSNDVLACQSGLVDSLLSGTSGEPVFNWDDVINLYQIPEGEEESEPQEIYEWWLVSAWLAEKLDKAGEPILDNEYGRWWGRTTTGQSLYIDNVLVDLAARFDVIDNGRGAE